MLHALKFRPLSLFYLILLDINVHHQCASRSDDQTSKCTTWRPHRSGDQDYRYFYHQHDEVRSADCIGESEAISNTESCKLMVVATSTRREKEEGKESRGKSLLARGGINILRFLWLLRAKCSQRLGVGEIGRSCLVTPVENWTS